MYGRALAKAHKIAADFRAQRYPGDSGLNSGVWAAKKSDAKGELYIYESIGLDWWTGGGITGKSVVAELKKIEGVKTLDIFINSPGGDVFEGKTIYNTIKRFDAEKIVHIDGIAASAASFIAMAGDKIITAENATWMIHEAWGGASGNAEDLRTIAGLLDIENAAIAGIYAARTGQPASSFWMRPAPSAADPSPAATGIMASDTWMSAAEALAAKLTDEIEKNAAADDDAEAEKLAAKIPALRIAAETQRRISAARVRQVDAERSVLNDRRRASPERSSTRPAARTGS